MKVSIEVEYTEKEVEALILSKHEEKWGAPPNGDYWHIYYGYKRYSVSNKPIAEKVNEEEGAE